MQHPKELWIYLLSLFVFVSLVSCSVKVRTTNGAIIGYEAHPNSSVVEFLGIPYAEPPVGRLRFSPPKPYAVHGTYKASHWVGIHFALVKVPDVMSTCPQTPAGPSDFPNLTPQAQRILYNFAGSKRFPQDEDCLTLNVWTRNPGSSQRKAKSRPSPVLIFFYGGRFSGGNTHTPFYHGYKLAKNEDVVVVTVNYRLNIFGFPGGPDTKQNLGLRDQRLAIEWLHNNIAAFGGDPNKLTIWGQSSGGVSVDYYSYAYASKPLVHALISDSGNAFSFPLNTKSQQESNWYTVSKALGCGSTGNTVSCMRQKKWQDVKEAVTNVPPAPGGSPVRSIPPFYPKVDGETVFGDYVSLAKRGAFAKLPYLLGNNNNEQGYYVIPAYSNNITITPAQGTHFLLSSFICPNKFLAKQRKKYNVPVYQYRYFGHWKNIQLYPPPPSGKSKSKKPYPGTGSGAYHGTELEMIFGNSRAVSGLPETLNEKKTSRLMQKLWVAFADDPVNGLKKFGWRVVDDDEESLAVIARGNRPEIGFVKPGAYDGTCGNVKLGSLT